ncbi:MAG: YicC family protein, partial [Chlorobi bacterium]|nr:YicC family protein [Chlorobiota bacterium]
MLISMTGFGRASVTRGHITATVEIRSLNNRFCEISARLPQSSLEK